MAEADAEQGQRERQEDGQPRHRCDPRPLADLTSPAGPAVGLVVVRVASEGQLEAVDPFAEQAEDRRQQGERGDDRYGDHDRRRVAECTNDRQTGEVEREQGDDDRAPGEQDRPAGGAGCPRRRLLDVVAVGHEAAMAGDDEERVVDPDSQPEHRSQRRRDRRHRDDVPEEADQAEAGREPEDRRQDRDRHRRCGPEGEEQHDDRDGDPDRLAGLGAGLGDGRAQIRAGCNLDALPYGRLGERDQRLRIILLEFVGTRPQVEGDIGIDAVLAEIVDPGRAERTDHRADPRILLVVVDDLLDRLLVRPLIEAPLIGLQRDRDDAVGATRKFVVQQIRGPGRVAAGNRQVVVGRLAEDRRRDHQSSGHRDPDPDHQPSAPGGESSKRVEGAGQVQPARIACAVRRASDITVNIGFVPDAVGKALASPIQTPGVS